MRFVIFSLLLCLAATPGIAQDSITPNITKNQINATLATGPDKIFTYAKFIGYGEPSAASVESVDSALKRLFALIAALPQSGGGGISTITLQFSDDGSSWHATQNIGVDNRLRINVDDTVIGTFAFPAPTPISLDVQFQYSANGTTWHTTEDEGTDTHWRFRVGDGAWTAALPIEHDVTAEDIAGLDTYIQRIIAPLQIPVGNITGFDARVEHLIDLEGLTESQIPLWNKPARQILRIGTAFTLDMSEYVDAATSYTASELPNGININTAGVLSGTPTHEGEWFPIIIATNVFDSATISFPMLVLRQESFATGQLQRLEGLTVNNTGKIVAIDESGGGSLRLFPHKGAPEAQADGLIPTAEATAVTLQPGAGVTAGYAGIAFDGTDYVTLADPNAQSTYSFIVFNSAGVKQGNTFANSRLAGARSLTYDSATSKYWAIGIAGGQTYASAFARSGNTLGQTGQPQHRISTSQLDAQGLVIKDTRFFVVDNSTNTVKAYSSTGTRGENETHRDFTLATANNRPRGLTYHENYFYVLNEGAGAINDTIFIYPDKGTWDATVPDLTLLEFVTRGPFIENNIIRVRATFTAPVDITADVKLRLDIGGQEREALSVASATAPVTAAAQTNTRTAYFAYTVQAANVDIDADGIETYQFPFKGGTGDGTIYPHTAWDRIDSHNLIGNNSRFRVTQPGGLRTLLPRTHQRVNATHQADWGEKDPDSPNFVARKPEFFPINPQDQGSLDHWNWVKSTSTGIEFLAEQQATDAAGILNTIEQDNGWATEHQTQPIPATEFLYIRWTAADTTRLAETFIQGTVPWYDKPLSTIPNSDKWVTYNNGQAYNGHFYYGLKQATGTTGTVFAATRQLPYTALTGTPAIPPAQRQVDWDIDSPANDVRRILNKPALPLSTRGSETNTVTLASGEAHDVRITIPQDIRNYATRYSQPIDVRIDTRWRRVGSVRADMEIHVLDHTGNDFSPQLLKRFEDVGTTWTPADYTFQVPATATELQVQLDRDDDGASNVEISHRDWKLEFGTAEIEEGSITTDKIADGAVTEPKLDVAGTPQQNGVIGYQFGQMQWIPNWEMLETVADSGAQVAITTGTPTLAQAAALTFRAKTLVAQAVRTGQIIVVKLDAHETYDINDYFAHIGHPEDFRYQTTAYLLAVNEMTHIGDQGGNRYYRSKGVTIPREAVYMCKIDAYRAKLVAKSVDADTGGAGVVRDVSGSEPITVTGTDTKNVSLDNNGIAPQFLKADTNTEKAAMRERIEAAWDAGLDMRIVISQATQGAGGAGANLDYQITITPALANYADNRPYEASLAVTIAGSATTSDVTITASLMNTALTQTYDTEDITSSAGTEATEYLSASLPAGATGFILRTVRKTGTLGYRREAEGALQVKPKSSVAEKLTWTPTFNTDNISKPTPRYFHTTYSYVMAIRQGNMLYVRGRFGVYFSGSQAHDNFSSAFFFHVILPTGITFSQTGQRTNRVDANPFSTFITTSSTCELVTFNGAAALKFSTPHPFSPYSQYATSFYYDVDTWFIID